MGQGVVSVLKERPGHFAVPLVSSVFVAYSLKEGRFWDARDPNILTAVLHLGSLGFNLGANIWHCFSAGIAARHASPQTRAFLQHRVYPTLSVTSTLLSATTLFTLLYFHPIWELYEDEEFYQVYALLVAFIGHASNTLLIPFSFTKTGPEEKEGHQNNETAKRGFKHQVLSSYLLHLVGFAGNMLYFVFMAKDIKEM